MRNTSIPPGNHVRCRKSRKGSSRGAETKGAPLACRSFVNRVGLVTPLAGHSWYDGMLTARCGIFTVVLLTFLPSITAKYIIRALLHPGHAHRPAAEHALSHTWLTSFLAPTEYNPCDIRENFDRRARRHNAIGAAWALSLRENAWRER